MDYIHRADLTPQEISQHEGMPGHFSVERSVMGRSLDNTSGGDIAQKAIKDVLSGLADCSMCIREAGFGGLITRSLL